MRYALFIYIASILPSFLAAPTSENVTVDYFINLINSRQSSWRAGKRFRVNTTIKTITLSYKKVTFIKEPTIPLKSCYLEGVRIPDTFDARTQWPECAEVIGNIRNQGLCNSCWAMAATAVMSDRLCIQTGGKVKFEFSPQDLVSCCLDCDHGCSTGMPLRAWEYYVKFGIVSGGGFTSFRGCKPYQESEFFYSTRSTCSKKCDNPRYNTSYIDDKHFGSEYYLVNKSPECIQLEIMTKGPVQTLMALYEDFAYYKEGVYFNTVGKRINTHSVKILGWGTENGIPYWLAANSWSCQWGALNGFFKIKRGNDECSFEQYVIAGNPKTDVIPDVMTHEASAHDYGWMIAAGVLIFITAIVLVAFVFSQRARDRILNFLCLY